MNENYEDAIYGDSFDDDDEGTIVSPEDLDDVLDGKVPDDNTDDDPNPNFPKELFDTDDEDVKVTFEQGEERDIIEDLLKSKNIDPTAIKFEDEEGNIVDKDFNELTYEEQLEILNYQAEAKEDDEEAFDYTKDEQELIQFLRAKGKSITDIINEREAAIRAEYEQESLVSIDSYNDEELYIYDLATRFPDLTDDELESKLILAMDNKSLFKRETEMLRKAYTEAERADKERVKTENEAKAAQAESDRRGKFEEVLREANSFADDVLIEDEDKQELLRYVFNKDPEGATQFDKDLKDESKLFQIAFISKFGESAIDMMKKNYEKKIEDEIKKAYAKGKEEAINGLPSKPKTIFRPKLKNSKKPEGTLERKFTPTEQTITSGRLKNLSDLYPD